ncbi:MAG: alanyl-tRNA editing protein [Infirmifilum sp.]
METELLYESNPYLKTCNARVLRVEHHKGRRFYLVMDKTIFHPLGGGQPSDEGRIKGEKGVFEVRKTLVLDGVLKHWGVLTEGSVEEGENVVCELDWEKRYLVMRLHTAGHILDYAMARLYGRLVDTVDAFHGPPEAYLEYNVENAPDPSALERLAREVVDARLDVVIKYVSPGELSKSIYNAPNLSRLPQADMYRIVEIPGVNAMPCTGTHVANTAEVGDVKILRVEKHTGYRVYYTVA